MTDAGPTPAVAFVTLGCPKNEVDSDVMAASLGRDLHVVGDVADADVVVVNTCAFITEATEESIGVVLELATGWKAERAGRLLVVAGCMPSRYGERLAVELPEVDAFVSAADEGRLAAVLASLAGLGTPAPTAGRRRTTAAPSAYLQVADGCHRACTYCTIPSIRGPYRSRQASDILDEARELVSTGVRELVLVGQDVSSWGRDLPGRATLADLVRRLSAVDGLRWLRLMYIQPDGITPDLLDAMAESPVVCRYLDMPLQHASRDVLRRMGRRGDGAEFLRLIGVIRERMPDVVLRTTLIAGFPGETRADSEALLRFVRKARLDVTGVFAYSPEEGTPAAAMPDQVPRRTRLARAQRVRDAADEIGAEKAAERVGRRLDVLVEGIDDEGSTIGRYFGQAPDVEGIVVLDRDVEPGRIVDAEVVDTVGYDLVAEVR